MKDDRDDTGDDDKGYTEDDDGALSRISDRTMRRSPEPRELLGVPKLKQSEG